MAAYYNEIDKFAAAWLRELIKAGLIADGEVDERSIVDVQPGDLRGFTQCHFFAGIGGWSYALRLAGWPDDEHVWTGSCTCQPISSAARGRTVAPDTWEPFWELIAQCCPDTVFSEQVVREWWIDRCVRDLEGLGYEIGAAILPAWSVGADHARERFYFVGHADRDGQPGMPVDAEMDRLRWFGGNARGVGAPNGVSRDVVALSGFGNAIVPQVAAIFIEAYMSIRHEPQPLSWEEPA